MADDIARLRHAISALIAQSSVLGADLVELALAPLRERLARLLDEPAAQQLRQVSVLFTDVVGSTSLSQHLGPEDISAVMDGALASFTRIVEQHGGCALQYAGDSMLAVFGTPTAHEDDAARAVRAALHILAEAREQGAAVKRRHGHDGFGVRAGIATGGVLLGGGVDGEHSIRGMTVNLAARMEQTAAPGSLRICPDTRRLVRGLFELVEQPPLQVKGRDEAITTWLVDGASHGAAAQAERGVGGLATPLIGRADELARMQTAYHAWCAHSTPAGRDAVTGTSAVASDPASAPATATALQIVIVLGDAGLGKSRLAAEFRAWTLAQAGGAQWLDAQAGERAQGRPYGLLRQLFTRRLRILDSDAAGTARDRWLLAMSALLRSQGDAAVLGHLLGLDFSVHDEVRPLLGEGKQLRDRGFFHASQALRRIAADGPPLLALIDDLHWADPGTLEFIDHLRAERADLPLLIVATARPLLDEQRPGWASAAAQLRIDLGPLGGAAAQDLANALLARLGNVPDDLRERLTQGAEGNPFFMEELVNMLIDRGVIVVDAADAGHIVGHSWTLRPERLESASLPTTLAGVLQARLDELPAEQAHALQLAAIIGHVFWDDALRALGLSGALPLPALSQRQFIVERPTSSLEGRHEFAFRHHLLHQVCYERVLQRVKQPAHARVARWLESLPGERPYDLIAGHHERGGELARALDGWHKASEVAQARYANVQALEHAARALKLTQSYDLRRRYALALLRAQVLRLLGRRDALSIELDALEQLARECADTALQSEAAHRRAIALYERGDARAALDMAEMAAALAPPHAAQQTIRAGLQVVHALHMLGRYDEARARAQTSLTLAQGIGDDALQGALLNAVGMFAFERGEVEHALTYFAQALVHHRTSGNRANEAGVLSNLGYAELRTGAYAAAELRLVEARAIFGRIGVTQQEALVVVNLALVALNTGHPAVALAHARAASSMLASVNCQWGEAAAWRVEAQAQLALSDAAAASALLHRAHARFVELGMAAMAMEVQALKAQVATAAGNPGAALQLAHEVLRELRDGVPLQGAEEPLRVLLNCWRALRSAGDLQADNVLGQAHASLVQNADRIGDSRRAAAYLHQVPYHQELKQAWDEHRNTLHIQSAP